MCGKFHTPLRMGQGNYFLPKSHKLAVKKGLQKQLWQPKWQFFFGGGAGGEALLPNVGRRCLPMLDYIR